MVSFIIELEIFPFLVGIQTNRILYPNWHNNQGRSEFTRILNILRFNQTIRLVQNHVYSKGHFKVQSHLPSPAKHAATLFITNKQENPHEGCAYVICSFSCRLSFTILIKRYICSPYRGYLLRRFLFLFLEYNAFRSVQ